MIEVFEDLLGEGDIPIVHANICLVERDRYAVRLPVCQYGKAGGPGVTPAVRTLAAPDHTIGFLEFVDPRNRTNYRDPL